MRIRSERNTGVRYGTMNRPAREEGLTDAAVVALIRSAPPTELAVLYPQLCGRFGKARVDALWMRAFSATDASET